MNLKDFNEFIKSGAVKRQTPNKQRALSIIEEVEQKKIFLETSSKQIPAEKMSANFVVDQCYDILIELIRAKMLIDGYNSGNSHEAEVSYLRILGFSEHDARFMNEIRYYRNGTKYYGTKLDMEYGNKVIEFMNRTYPTLKKLLKENK